MYFEGFPEGFYLYFMIQCVLMVLMVFVICSVLYFFHCNFSVTTWNKTIFYDLILTLLLYITLMSSTVINHDLSVLSSHSDLS